MHYRYISFCWFLLCCEHVSVSWPADGDRWCCLTKDIRNKLLYMRKNKKTQVHIKYIYIFKSLELALENRGIVVRWIGQKVMTEQKGPGWIKEFIEITRFLTVFVNWLVFLLLYIMYSRLTSLAACLGTKGLDKIVFIFISLHYFDSYNYNSISTLDALL